MGRTPLPAKIRTEGLAILIQGISLLSSQLSLTKIARQFEILGIKRLVEMRISQLSRCPTN
jgi:hypothetical protein